MPFLRADCRRRSSSPSTRRRTARYDFKRFYAGGKRSAASSCSRQAHPGRDLPRRLHRIAARASRRNFSLLLSPRGPPRGADRPQRDGQAVGCGGRHAARDGHRQRRAGALRRASARPEPIFQPTSGRQPMASKDKEHPRSRRCGRAAPARSRSPSPTSTASCAASTCTRTSSSAPRADRGGFGFCDVVFGWDSSDVMLRQHAAHRLAARLSRRAGAARPRHATATCRGTTTCRSSSAIRQRRRQAPSPICPRQTLKRVLKRAEKLGFAPMCGMEFEWFNFPETPQSWAAKKGVGPSRSRPGMFGYSLLRMNQNREFFNALMDEMARVRRADRGPAHRDRPRRLRGRDRCSARRSSRPTARSCSRPAPRRSARASASCRASWPSGTSSYPGCCGHIHQSLSGRQDEPVLRRQGAAHG